MAFITKSDLNLNMYREVVDAITREDDLKIDEAIETAISEVDSHLNQKYDTAPLWAQTGTARNKMLKHVTIHLALWHMCSPLDEIPAAVADNYKHAEKILNKISTGQIGLPLPTLKDSEDNELFIRSGNSTKRY